MMRRAGFQNPHRGPGRHDESHHQRENHRGARANGDGPHVRTHQAAYESHGKNRRNHRERGEDRGIAHFVHGLDSHFKRGPAVIGRHTPVPHDVFDHHNRVVHQDADGEDQSKERDAVQRVAVKIEHGQRERQRYGNRDEDDQRLAKTQRDRDEQAYRNHGDQHVPQQLVRFLLGRVAVIARDGHLNIGRNHAAAQRFQPVQDIFRDCNRIGSLALRYGDGDGRIKAMPIGEAHILRRLLAAIGHLGDVAHEDRLAIGDARHHVAHVVRVRRNCPVSSRYSWFPRANSPEGSRRLEAPSAPTTCKGERW